MKGNRPEVIGDVFLGGQSLQTHASSERTNSRGKRLATAAVGSVLLTAGIRRRSLSGTLMAVGGGWLIARGISGSDRPVRALSSMISGGRSRDEAGVPEDAPAVKRSITVGAPADELTEYWRDPEQVTQLMGSFAEVTGAGEDRLHWKVQPPRGPSVTWETEIVEDRPGELLRWKSVEGSPITNEGTVRFRSAPGDRGTEVTLELAFDPPGGTIGDAMIQRLGVVPKAVAGNALDRFKSLVETGEIPSLEHNPSARGSGDLV